ncbi:uncharacterized protein LOC125883186 [Epinephelus fuscoguttatus]|uniref:uncharacterized protein LOC125883186 n=1 Tax=Epinephelus fuscoguttatus TaxID=293821 RepID=UPI0020D1C037|nr:uncharacterized protein LOC125883186 [Epinephelus fuscoguttatus]
MTSIHQSLLSFWDSPFTKGMQEKSKSYSQIQRNTGPPHQEENRQKDPSQWLQQCEASQCKPQHQPPEDRTDTTPCWISKLSVAAVTQTNHPKSRYEGKSLCGSCIGTWLASLLVCVMFAEGKQMLTLLLHLKRKEKTCEPTNKNCLGRQQKPQSAHWSVPPYNASKHVPHLRRRWMLLVFKHVIRGYGKRELKNFQKFISGAHYIFS